LNTAALLKKLMYLTMQALRDRESKFLQTGRRTSKQLKFSTAAGARAHGNAGPSNFSV